MPYLIKEEETRKHSLIKRFWYSFQTKDRFTNFFLVFLLLLITVTPFIINNSRIFTPKVQVIPKFPQTGYLRGVTGDGWADIIIGKPNFSEVSAGTVTPHKLWIPSGAIADQVSNLLYIYDGGNNRILGFDINKCMNANTNFIAGCSADMVIGQPDGYSSACNGDSGYQNFPNRASASASSLCTLQDNQVSLGEGGSGNSMAVNLQGDLYVADYWNHRILKYIKPFTTDSIADDVWGQANFTDNSCNLGQPNPSVSSLCFTWGDINNKIAGVEATEAGDIWVADSGNNRVLHFAPGSKTADLVLGQAGFVSKTQGAGLNQFHGPNAVRVNSQGWVYVSDKGNARVLRFKTPITSGMAGEVFASNVGTGGLTWDVTEPGKIWISDVDKHNMQLWDETTSQFLKAIGGNPGNANKLNGWMGSVGIDSVGNMFAVSYIGEIPNDALYYKKTNTTFEPDRILFGANAQGGGSGAGNARDAKGLYAGAGIVVSDNQLIVADNARIMFWNDPTTLSNGKPADGVAGHGIALFSNFYYGCCGPIRADKNHHLYVVINANGPTPAHVDVYQLPLVNGATAIATVAYPLNVLTGGTLTKANFSSIITGIQPTDDGNFLWMSDGDQNRVIRVRNPLTTPIVDIILGQTTNTGTLCNMGTGVMANNSLCWPGHVSLDKLGNLYVADASLEIRGNYRLLEFNNDIFPTDNTAVIYAPAATKIFPKIAPWGPTFDSQNHMVVGYNSYYGENPQANPNGSYFPGLYLDPLSQTSVLPDAHLNDFYSMSFSAAFDDSDNLYVGDLNRSRVLIYKKPFGLPASSPTALPTQVPTPTPTPAPTQIPTPTPTTVPDATAASSPISIWTSQVPSGFAYTDTRSVELGVKFRSTTPGYIKGIRFYKGAQTIGTHSGTLWSRTGTKLASANFTNETASGWQQVNFATSVAVLANTTYVASYHASSGRYAFNSGYFATTALTNVNLTALRNGTDGSNGVYRYGSAVVFPNSSYNSTHYWVDVLFSTTP